MFRNGNRTLQLPHYGLVNDIRKFFEVLSKQHRVLWLNGFTYLNITLECGRREAARQLQQEVMGFP